MEVSIPEVQVNDLNISIQSIPTWRDTPPASIPVAPPLTLNIGIPVIDIPGCVRAHIDNKKSKTLPEDDDRGVRIFCDGTMPTFETIEYRPDEMVFSKPPTAPPLNNPPPTDKPLDTPPSPPNTSIPSLNLPCPPPDAIPIGAKNKAQTKIIIGYELKNGECITLYEPIPLLDVVGNHLPGAPIVITTTVIAASGIIGATLAKPLGDYLLKLIKPLLKQVKKKVFTLLGKKQKILSVAERAKAQKDLRK